MIRRLLVNKQDEELSYLIKLSSWHWALGMACDNGWEPAGTLESGAWRDLDYHGEVITQMAIDGYWDLPGSYDRNYTFASDPSKTWSGTYSTDQGQEVTAADAIGLTKAMQRANGSEGPIRRIEMVSTLELKYLNLQRCS